MKRLSRTEIFWRKFLGQLQRCAHKGCPMNENGYFVSKTFYKFHSIIVPEPVYKRYWVELEERSKE